jgi:hypothetical protein
MGFASWSSIRFLDLFILDTSKTVYLIILFIISTLIGIATYIAFTKILKIEEYKDYLAYLDKFKKIFFK